jgi:gliding motility-associated-like protein
MSIKKRFHYILFFILTLTQYANAQCGAKIGLEPGSVITGCGFPLAIHFNSKASVGVQDLQWNFGDASTSFANNPIHEFFFDSIQKKDAIYKVVLTVNCVNGSKSKDSVMVTALKVPDVSFIPDTTIACQLGNPVCFTNLSENNSNYSYLWNFDLGETSTEFAPCHKFSLSGNKKPRLTVTTQQNCAREYTLPYFIEVVAIPNPSFIASPQTGCNPLNVKVTNNTDPDQVDKVTWLWGDGTFDTIMYPQNHTYFQPGVFNLKLKIVNPIGCENTSELVINNQPTPETKISLSNDMICLEKSVQVVQDTTTYPGATYTWSFDSPSVLTGSDKGPYDVTWSEPGMKFITLNVNLNGCVGTSSKIVFVNPFSMVHLEEVTQSSLLCEKDEVQYVATPSYYNNYFFIVNNDTIQNTSSNFFSSTQLKKNDIVEVKAIDRSNCPCYTVTSPLTVNVKPLPNVTISATPSGSSICKGDTIVISALPAGYDDYHFYDGNVLFQQGSSTLVFDYTKASGNPIKVIAFNNGCISDTTNAATYIAPQVIEPLVRPQINCNGSTVGAIKFAWDSVPGATGYEIQLNGGAWQSVNGTLSHQILLASDSTVYAFVKAKGSSPCFDGLPSLDSATCKSIPCTALTFTKSQDLELCKGKSAYISIKDISVPNFDIYWNNSTTPTANRLKLIEPDKNSQYYVSVKNTDEPNCPMTTKYIDVVVNDIPTVSIISSVLADSICEKTPITFTAQSDQFDSYEFYNNWDLVQSSTSPIYKISDLKDEHQIRVKAINNGCKSDFSNPISYRVFKQLTQTQVVCGQTSMNSVSFLWDPIPGATGYMISVDSVGGAPNFKDVGNILDTTLLNLQLGVSRTLTVKPYGETPCEECYEYASASCFTENCVPIDFEKSNDMKVCEGDTVQLFVKNVSIPSYLVSWDAQKYGFYDTIKKFTFLKDTIIMVSVKNNDQPQCNSAKKYFKIKVNPLPQVQISSVEYKDSICTGNAATFIANPSGYDEYYFYDNWNLVQNSTSPIYVCNKYIDKHVILVIPKDNGCINYVGAKMQRDAVEPLDAPQVNCGKTTTGSIEFVWDSIPGAQGYEVSVNDNSFIPANGTFSHTITTTPATQVFIEVIATGNTPCGNSLSSNIWAGNLRMCETKPCDPINFTRPINMNICAGEQVNLSIKDLTEPSNYSVSWDNLPESNQLTYSIIPIATDTIPIVYTDKNQLGCSPSTKYTVIKVFPIPVTTLTANQDSVCMYDSLEVSSVLKGLDNYKFYSNSQLLYSGNYYGYTLHNMLIDTSVYLTLTHQGCTYTTLPYDVTTIPLQNVTLTTSEADNIVCENDKLKLDLHGSGYDSYAFYRNDSLLQLSNSNSYIIPRIYLKDSLRIDSVYAYGYNFFGCKSKPSNLVKHSILPKTNVTLSGQKPVICLYENIGFSVLPSDLVNYSFLNNSTEFKTGPAAQIQTNTIGFTNKVQVIATNLNGCKSDTSNAIVLTVKPVANPKIVASDTVICIGETIDLTAQTDNAYPNPQYIWSNSETNKSFQYTPNNSNEIQVYTMYNSCKSLVDSLDIIVDLVKPVIDSVLPITSCIGSEIQLEGNGGTNYKWFPADSVSDPFIQSPAIKVWNTMDYTFVVTNIACQDSSKIRVIMDLCLSELPDVIPQIITPNGDGINDIWDITHVDYFTENSLKIFNRWGVVVFEAAPYTNTWKGQSMSDKELPNGTYFYKLDLGPNRKSYSGYVVINR